MRAALLFLAALLPLHAADPMPAQADGPNGHRFCVVPAGEWTVGSEGHYFNPRRRVKLAAYRIALHETTNAQFAEFVKATGYVTDAEKRGFGRVCLEGNAEWQWHEVKGAHWRLPQGPGEGRFRAEKLPSHPVTQISGADAQAYCRWLGGRLPTVAEWEVAARGDVTTLYPWGDQWDDRRANIWNGATHRKDTRQDGWTYTAPVGSFAPNPWGLHDVIGNVFEYCGDLPLRIPRAQRARLIAGRGGSWWCSAGTCSFYNLADIGTQDIRGSLSNQGFRVAMGE